SQIRRTKSRPDLEFRGPRRPTGLVGHGLSRRAGRARGPLCTPEAETTPSMAAGYSHDAIRANEGTAVQQFASHNKRNRYARRHGPELEAVRHRASRELQQEVGGAVARQRVATAWRTSKGSCGIRNDPTHRGDRAADAIRAGNSDASRDDLRHVEARRADDADGQCARFLRIEAIGAGAGLDVDTDLLLQYVDVLRAGARVSEAICEGPETNNDLVHGTG